MVRIERESESRRRGRNMADLLVLPRPAKGLQNGTDFSRKLEHTEPAEKDSVASVPQREQVASTPDRDCIVFFCIVLFIFILHSRESKLYCYFLDGTSVLAWVLPFAICLGHLSFT